MARKVDSIAVSLTFTIGTYRVPLCDADGQPVDSVDLEGDASFVKLATRHCNWLVAACASLVDAPQIGRDIKYFKKSRTYHKLKSAINACFGKRKRASGRVDATGMPMSKTDVVELTIDGETIECLPNKHPIYMRATPSSLRWLANSLATDICDPKNGSTGHDTEGYAAINRRLMEHAFSKDDVEEMKNYNIKWHPSRRDLVCRDTNGVTHKIRIKLKRKNMKKSNEKIRAHIARKAAEAKRAAIKIVDPSAAQPEGDVRASESSSPRGGPSASSSESDE